MCSTMITDHRSQVSKACVDDDNNGVDDGTDDADPGQNRTAPCYRYGGVFQQV